MRKVAAVLSCPGLSPFARRAAACLVGLFVTTSALTARAAQAPEAPTPPAPDSEPAQPTVEEPPAGAPSPPPPSKPSVDREPAPEPRASAGEEQKGLIDRYRAFMRQRFEEVAALDLYGISATIPGGYLKLRYEYSPARAAGFFNRDGDRVRLLPPVTLAGSPSPTIVDPIVKGRGAGHSFNVTYGITDRVSSFATVQFTEINSSMDLRVSRGGQPLSKLDRALFDAYIESNGRPMPNSSYDGKLNLENIILGTSVNYFRTPVVSVASVPRVSLPVGTNANPNNDLTFLRGPEVDRGIPGWAILFGQQFDVRPIRWLNFNAELTATYKFRYSRPSPQWNGISDCRRVADSARRDALSCGAAVPYDRAYDLEQSQNFPDMSGLAPTYHVTPGLTGEALLGFTAVAVFIPVQFYYSVRHSEAPFVEATGTGDAGIAFERTVKQFQLLEASTLHTLGTGIAIPLFPLLIPARVNLAAKWAVAGQNTMILADQYSIAFELFLPVVKALSPRTSTTPSAARSVP